MTQEEKAKCYDEALEIAKKNYVTVQDLCEGSQMGVECFKNTLESIFPELKSEDERIKKEIIEYIKTGTYHKKWIAWLEKQGEKDKLIRELGEYKVKYIQETLGKALTMNNKDDERVRKTTIAFLKDFADKGYENAVECIDWLEKQGEQFDDNIITSSDERIRKAILEGLIDCRDAPDLGWSNFGGIEIDDCIDWLEKQGQTFTKKDVDDAYLKGVADTKNEIEKQYEANYQIRKDIATFLFNYNGDIKDRAKWMNYLGIKVSFVEKKDEPNPYSGVSFKYNGHTWGMCARDNGVEILVDGKIKERVFLENKPQGKSALEAIQEEKVDNANKIGPKDYSSIDPHFGKPIDNDKVVPKFKVGDIVQYITDSTDRRKIEEIDTLCNMYYTDSFPIIFEVEDEWKAILNSENVEQKLADKVEPKLKIEKDKWYVCIRDLDDNYGTKAFDKGSIYYSTKDETLIPENSNIPFEIKYCVNDYFRPWTIKDAKDGDVLANDHHILILKELVYDWSSNGTPNSVKAYCGIKPNGNFEIGKRNYCFCGTLHIHPATKEQRKLLFQKMREAGYEWDSGKKELIKVFT